jgi:DNA-binding transcriptional LysR family regulator
MNRVTVFELECFVAVAEELHFAKAAKRLHISQPPLTRQIQALEHKLGVSLLKRNTRSTTLTAAGLLYLEDARRILTLLDSAAATARRATAGEGHRLRLAFVGALLDENLVDALQRFRKQHPQCQIHLSDLAPAAQLEALKEGELDGAFIGAAPNKTSREISVFTWKKEPFLILLPEQHSLATRKTVSLSELENDDWVMISRTAAPAFRHQFEGLCREADIRARLVQESERAAAILTMVAAGQGISMLPASISRLVHPGVVFKPIRGITATLKQTFACRAGENSQAIHDFLGLLGIKQHPQNPSKSSHQISIK